MQHSDVSLQKLRVSHEQFVVIWTVSNDVDDVLTRIRCLDHTATRKKVLSRADHLRREGVDLKMMGRCRQFPELEGVNVDAMNNLIDRLAQEAAVA